jgi:hypothetical protein
LLLLSNDRANYFAIIKKVQSYLFSGFLLIESRVTDAFMLYFIQGQVHFCVKNIPFPE